VKKSPIKEMAVQPFGLGRSLQRFLAVLTASLAGVLMAPQTIAQSAPNQILNNRIPVSLNDAEAPLIATKIAATTTASTGAIVPYTIMISNPSNVTANDVDIVDDLPLGGGFIEGSSLVNGLEVTPLIDGNRLTFEEVDIPAGGSAVVTLSVVVGSGANEGGFVNQAFAQSGLTGALLTDVALATVRIEPDDIFDCSEVIGKVFHDLDQDGYQDQDEPGLPGVRVATVNGLLITTDEFGRYHIACAATPRAGIGSNFIVKLDERTLPSDYTLTTENPRVVRLTEGKLTSADFGVSGPRRIRVDLRPEAFVPGDVDLLPEWEGQLGELLAVLEEERSILILSYDGGDLGAVRLSSLSALVRQRWDVLGEESWSRRGEKLYKLSIETERLSSADGER